MGCGSSAFDEQFSKPAMQDCLRQFKAMQFSNSDIRKLYDIFRAVDVDGSGSIALSELLTHIHLDRTPFTEKIFSIFDDDRSGEIDFKEFVMSLWNYCTLTKATLGTHLYVPHNTCLRSSLYCPLRLVWLWTNLLISTES